MQEVAGSIPVGSTKFIPMNISYIAFLRGINVGGHRIIKMAALRDVVTSLGHSNVKTFIQSGNVGFESTQMDLQGLEQGLEAAIEKAFGFPVTVMVRPLEDVVALADTPPIGDVDSARIYVTFLKSVPSPESLATLVALSSEAEQILPHKGVLYLYYGHGAGKAKLTHSVIEKKLQTSGTTRNWQTLGKMIRFFTA